MDNIVEVYVIAQTNSITHAHHILQPYLTHKPRTHVIEKSIINGKHSNNKLFHSNVVHIIPCFYVGLAMVINQKIYTNITP